MYVQITKKSLFQVCAMACQIDAAIIGINNCQVIFSTAPELEPSFNQIKNYAKFVQNHSGMDFAIDLGQNLVEFY